MAVNCRVVPADMVGLTGVTAIEVSVGTVMVVLPAIPPRDADMAEVPAATPVARPPVVMVATAVFEEVHVTWPVMFRVLPSE